MKRPTTKALTKVARLELDAWHNLNRGMVMAILFSFIHRFTTGETVEETFSTRQTFVSDYEI